MSTMTQYGNAGLLERLTSSTAFAVLLGTAATVLAPVILYFFTLYAQCLLLGVVLARVVAWEALGLLLLPIGGMVGYLGLFRARQPATSTIDYWVTITCLGVGLVTAVTVIAGLLYLDFDYRVLLGSIAALSLPIVAALGRIERLRRLRIAARTTIG